jgi:predicted GNAT family N-acyltransferase
VIDLVPWQAVLPVRHQVLRPGRPLETAQFEQDAAPDTFHVAAHDSSGAVIGCATFFPDPLDNEPGMPRSSLAPAQLRSAPPTRSWVLRGMATLPEYRGQGVGGQVLGAGMAEVTRRGGAIVWCRGRVAAGEFYRRHGFVAQGEEFQIEHSGPHYVFVCKLPADELQPSSPV